MYEDGKGVPQNDVEAYNWFKKAAEDNIVVSLGYLSLMYEEGRGTPRDLTVAYDMLTKAVSFEPAFYDDRALFQARQENYDQALLDWYRFYETHEPYDFPMEQADWAEAVNHQFKTQAFPQIQVAGERYLFRSPCGVLYNFNSQDTNFYEGRSYTQWSGTRSTFHEQTYSYLTGTYSTGYFVLTDRGIYLYNFVTLTKDYCFIKKFDLREFLFGRASRNFKTRYL